VPGASINGSITFLSVDKDKSETVVIKAEELPPSSIRGFFGRDYADESFQTILKYNIVPAATELSMKWNKLSSFQQ
jgi:hypothetical protein